MLIRKCADFRSDEFHGHHDGICSLIRCQFASYSVPELRVKYPSVGWHPEVCMVEYIWRVQHWGSVRLVTLVNIKHEIAAIRTSSSSIKIYKTSITTRTQALHKTW